MMQALPTFNSRAQRIHAISRQLLSCVSTGARSGGDARAIAEQLRDALQSLGVTFVKLGQTLATRRDLLPEPYIDSLSTLTHEVAAVPWAVIEQTLEETLGQPLSAVFAWIDEEPLGAASIAQVHAARLHDGREVAVKVRRPGGSEQVADDLALLRSLAAGADTLGAGGEAIRLAEVVESFALATELELDYRIEARNLRRIRSGLRGFPRLRVPMPIRDLVFENVLVMERMPGVPLHTADEVVAGHELAHSICSAYLHQVLELGFFHADPHPGNLLLDEDGTLALIDLGMTEVVDEQDQFAFAELVNGLAQGSTGEVVNALLSLSTPTAHADEEALRAATRRAVRRAVALRGVEPTFGATTFALLRAMLDHGFRPAPQLSVLARTLAMLDEVLALLDPTFDTGEVVREHAGHQLWREVQNLDPGLPLAQLARRSPRTLTRLLDQLADGRLTFQIDALDEDRVLASVQKVANRIAGALIVAALLVGGAITGSLEVGNLSPQGIALLGMGGVGAASLLLSILVFDR